MKAFVWIRANILLKIVDSQSVSQHPSILEAAIESAGDHSDRTKEVTERMIVYLKKKSRENVASV